MDAQALSPEIIQDTSFIREISADNIAATFESDTIDLISKPLGSRVLAVSDEFFCSATNLTTPTPPIHKPNTFTHAGAWYDGWETRRHNPSYDFVVFALGVPSGTISGIEIDTGFFSGNHAPAISVYASLTTDLSAIDPTHPWTLVLPLQPCGPAARYAWSFPPSNPVSHVRLCMHPDGGIGRFRVYGRAVPVFPPADTTFDLAAMSNGGVATSWSDAHFGRAANLLLPGRGVDMGDGWETKRTRGPHEDWVVVRLGASGHVSSVVVDTAHFRGNYPQKVQLFAAPAGAEPSEDAWREMLSPKPCGPDTEHVFAEELRDAGSVGYVKMVIIPDGGVKRLRVFGTRDV